MYMFNLLFDPSRTDGLFEDPPVNPGAGVNDGLRHSKHWLFFPTPSPPPNFNHENPGMPNWDDLGPAGTLLIKPAPAHAIVIRIAPVPPPLGAQPFDTGATAEFVAAFGRPAIARQRFASPFMRPNGRTIAMFSLSLQAADRPAGGGWRVDLPLMNRPGPGFARPNHTFRYEFAVGVDIIDGNGQRFSFGEDPEFDVGG